MFYSDVRCRTLAPMWTPLSRASGPDGVPQLRRSSARWRWRRLRSWRHSPRVGPRTDPPRPPTTGSSTPGSRRSTRSWGRVACRATRASRSAATARAAGPRSSSGSPPRRRRRLDRGLARPVAQLRPGRGGRPRRPPGMARGHHPGDARRGPRHRWRAAGRALGGPARPRPARWPAGRHGRPARIADRLGRLAALARRSETLLVVLEPPGAAGGLTTAVAEATGLRLELARRSWIRLGRDVVGQRTEALVARNRYGPPGRRATLRILYAEGGERDACLRRDDLLHDEAPDPAPAIDERTIRDATPPSPPAAPPPRTRPGASLRALPARPARPGRPAVGSGPGRRREPGSPGAGRPAGDAARERPSARP